MGGTEVRPFAEIGFAQDDGARGAQPGGDGRILRGAPFGQGQRTCGGAHGIARFDIVLEQNRDAVQGAAHVAVLAFLIELAGDGGGIGIDGEHGAELGGPLPLNGLDASEIELDETRRGPLALFQAGARSARLTSSSSKAATVLEEAEVAGTYLTGRLRRGDAGGRHEGAPFHAKYGSIRDQ